MKDLIYIPVMIISSAFNDYFFHTLANAITNFKTPDGIEITGVYDASDRLMEIIFNRVAKMNDDRCEDPYWGMEPFSMLAVEVETEQLIRYQYLPWLDVQIKEFVKKYDGSVGLYFNYLIDGGQTFHTPNVAKIINDDETLVFDDDNSDNFEALIEYAPFLSHFWYRFQETPVEEAFPDIYAKLCLVLGN